MNAQLVGTFQEWEMVDELKQIAPLKALSPDGMPLIFYQHFWQVVDQELIHLILSWLSIGRLPYLVNHTFIILILKITSLEHVHQFHPISLCNILYKIFSKLLAYRLKKNLAITHL